MHRFALSIVVVMVAVGLSASAFAQSTPLPKFEGSVDAKLQQVAAHLKQRTSAIAQHQARSAQIDAEVGQLMSRRQEHEGRLSERAGGLYRLRRAGMLPMAGGFDGLMKHLARVNRLQRMVKEDLDAASFLAARGNALKTECERLDATVADLNGQIQALRNQEQVFHDERQATDLFAETLRGQSSHSASERGGDLAYGKIALSGGGDTDTGFRQMRGRLAFPIQGARRILDSSDDTGAGLDFVSRVGTAVRCAADGRVAYAQAHGSHGPTVIVDHGDNFYTVYAGLASVGVQVGDWIGMSARIGAVGENGNESALYFEVRKGNKSLNARSWLGL